MGKLVPYDEKEVLDRTKVCLDDVESKATAYAIIAKYQPGSPPTHLRSIKIQSPYLLEFLSKVFKGYPGVNPSPSELEFTEPFLGFFYRWGRFENIMAEENDEVALSHIKMLHGLMAEDMMAKNEKVIDLLSKGLIDFDHIFALFEPSTEVYRKTDGQDCLYLVSSEGEYSSSGFGTKQYYIDYDGLSFGYGEEHSNIARFQGTLSVSELPYFPISAHPDKTMREKLTKRGRRFAQLNGFRYRSYAGNAVLIMESRHPQTVFVDDSRVIVDPGMYLRYNPGEVFLSNRRVRLGDDDYAFCTPEVRGYCLKHMGWANFLVDSISEIEWIKEVFENLVLEPQFKQVIRLVVDAHLSSKKDQVDDVIHGKGIIILLQGETGTGKTMTAASIAEGLKRPLYMTRAGEFGETAAEVEKGLGQILEICNSWGAVLLLDECGVFLEKRTEASLGQNRLVAVFLRLLENYKGIMFLKTSPLSSMEPAFESCIDLTIHYPQLSTESRLRIWQNHVPVTVDGPIRLEHLRLLAALALNGHQIKSAAQTARLVAEELEEELAFGHLEGVLVLTGFGGEKEEQEEEEEDYGKTQRFDGEFTVGSSRLFQYTYVDDRLTGCWS
ncbi:P-loop containing nucleoside triphosphate hydrolase protein [Whalleya microplaca]|nr:P-loop containing nucleoside triphosphate hydrolase protein [Whalleya microplaca]